MYLFILTSNYMIFPFPMSEVMVSAGLNSPATLCQARPTFLGTPALDAMGGLLHVTGQAHWYRGLQGSEYGHQLPPFVPIGRFRRRLGGRDIDFHPTFLTTVMSSGSAFLWTTRVIQCVEAKVGLGSRTVPPPASV